MSGLQKTKGLLAMQRNSGAMRLVSWLNLGPCGSFPVPFCSLSVLMMDSCWRCMCETQTHTHTCTQWNLPSLCFHLHLFSLVFLHVAVCVRKMGRCTHSLSELCVCCVRWARVGDVFFRGGKAILWRQFLSALNYLLCLTTFIYGQHVHYTFEEKATRTNSCFVFLYIYCFFMYPCEFVL